MDAYGQLSDSERKQLEAEEVPRLVETKDGIDTWAIATPDSVSSGAWDIISERNRQIHNEGYTKEGDKGRAGELIMAAQSYIALYQVQHNFKLDVPVDQLPPPNIWPWDAKMWKPSSDMNRNLVKAGALLAAAIDAGGTDGTNSQSGTD